jgi:hypothetical protein
MSIAPGRREMGQLNWGYVQLGLFALVFSGVEIW